MAEKRTKTLYLQLSRHNDVTAGTVCVADIAEIYGTDVVEAEAAGRIEVARIVPGKYGRSVLSAGEVAQKILAVHPEYTLFFLGDPELVLEYKKPEKMPGIRDILWSLFVSVVIFVGSAFTFMTFIHEANINGLFSRIYLYLGMRGAVDSKGIEISFAIGVGIGMLLYFNHFGSFRLQDEPTPMEMEMKQYMQEAEETILEQPKEEI